MGPVADERARQINGFLSGFLLSEGLITLEQLDQALERQLSLAAQGRALRLADVLVEIGAIEREDLDRVLAQQAAEELEFRRTARRGGN